MDIIQLLPDAIANQIAAGEVIQRPASVVKELMENAIDAGATKINLVIKDAGKTLIQVIDNGQGMSVSDARLAFERHATSKIRKADDLHSILTMGFRGEALASIAAIAQVELKTRLHDEELGTRILIEGSEVTKQESTPSAPGTTFSVKNLFYNVPARRKFLKSDPREMKHILDEFQRLALAHPDLFLTLHHNENEVFHLQASNLRQRIVGIFGNSCNKKLVPIGEETNVMKIHGYVGKPEFAKKTRGEQLFFVNKRFIKSSYLNHAVMSAYEGILQKETFPLYVIFLEMDPAMIDVNVHPTKQEIKFEDEKLVYNYLKVTVRHALGQYSITPTLDFNQEVGLTRNMKPLNVPTKVVNTDKPDNFTIPSKGNFDTDREKANIKNWQKLFDGLEAFEVDQTETSEEQEAPINAMTIGSQWELDGDQDQQKSFSKARKAPYQIHSKYIVSHIKSGFLLIDQQAAHERIQYERYLTAMKEGNSPTQQELFPKTITLPVQDADLLRHMLYQINTLGFDIREFGNNAFIIHGLPADVRSGEAEKVLEKLMELYKNNLELNLDLQDNLARALARSTAVKRGQKLDELEMQALIDQLFACEVPYKSPYGQNCFLTYELDDLAKRFND